MNEQLLTIREVARICRVHEVTIRREIARGRLKAVRIGRQLRIRREDADSLAEPSPWNDDGDWDNLKPIEADDPIFGLVGIASVPEAAGMAEDKYAFLPDPH